MVPIYLREPCNRTAQERSAAVLARRASEAPLDLSRLRADRQRAACDADVLVARFAEALAARGVRVTWAPTAAAAAARIAALAQERPVAASRAAVVAELYESLLDLGVRVISTYGPQGSSFAPRYEHAWQLPRPPALANWQTRPWQEPSNPPRALLGLLGVNAASAANGSLYLLQHSENIGELLAAAQTLVFAVGREKIVADDAAAQRQVAACSAYGCEAVLLDLGRTPAPAQPLAALAGLSEGERAVEVILLDNGRRDLLEGPHRALYDCIGCRACSARCPTYPFFRGPRGWSPKDYLWSHLRGENPSLDLCTLCGNCEADCPLDIPIPAMIAARRQETLRARGRNWGDWQRRVQGNVEALSRAFSRAAPVSNHLVGLPPVRAVMDKVFGIAPQRQLPRFRRDRFDARPRRPAGNGTPPVVYFYGCFANYNHPEVAETAVRILEHLGYQVLLPPWKCCGIPLYAKGEIDAARRLVEFNVRTLAAYAERGLTILTTCPSCQLALARDYPRLFPSSAADRVAAHTRFISPFLLERGVEGTLPGRAWRVGYHLPCHLRALGLRDETPQLLARVRGVEVAPLDRGCCGLSGTFGLERAHYRESMAIGAGLFAAARSTRWDEIATDCGACKLQIEHGTGRQVVHPLEILARAELSARAVPAAAAMGGSGR